MKPILFFLILFSAMNALASIVLPRDLDSTDRKNLLGILGYGSQTKLLSSPVPLGGHQGFEVGLSSEYVPVGDIVSLGSRTASQSGMDVLNLSIGKGFAYNLDGFLQLTPLPQSEDIFAYGVAVRWGFYELQDFPGIFSAVFHASGANYQNLLDTRTTGIDVIMTVVYRDLSIYGGGGPIEAFGSFMGGTEGITASDDGGATFVTHQENLKDMHYVAGASMNFDTLILSLEVDRVVESVFSARLGVRF